MSKQNKRRLQMQTQYIPAGIQHKAITPGSPTILGLLRTIDEKDKEIETLSMMVTTQQRALESVKENGHVTIIENDHTHRVSYPVEAYDELRNIANREIQLAYVLGDFKALNREIDLLAIHCSLTDLGNELAGFDERLSMLQTRLIARARGTSLEPELLKAFGQYAALRIEGIQRVAQDRGDYLRQVIAATSQDLTEKAQAAIDKARQGRHREPKTERIYQYGIAYKYDAAVLWRAAAKNLIRDLIQQNTLDAVDKDILADLQLYDDERERGDVFKNAFHNAKTSLGV